MAEIKKISTEFQLLDKFLDTSGDAGTSGQVLISTATGIDWADGSAITGGPFLPLAGGTITGVIQFNDHTIYGDQVYAKWGAANDLTIGHNATNSVISNAVGNLYISNHSDDKDIIFECDNGSGASVSYLTLNGSTTHAYFSNPGNVGIGTTSPQAALHVAGAFNTTAPTGNGVLMGFYSSSHGYIQLNGPSGGYIDFSTSGTDHKGRLLYDNTSNYMRFDTNGSEKMRITSAGNVGIGTTSPYSNLWVSGLGINAASELTTTDTTSNAILALAGTNSLVRLQMGTMDVSPWGGWIQASYDNTSGGSTNGVAPLLLNPLGGAAGNVGIGNTNPQSTLHLGDNANASAGTLRLDSFAANQFWKLEPGTNTLNIKDYDGTSLASFDGANNYVLFNGGNVGIGTTTPDAKLSVTSTTLNSEDILYLKSGADNVNDYLGIAWELGVGGNGPHSAIRSFAGPSGSDARLGFLTTSDGGTTLTEGLSIAHDGNVGIGDASPTQISANTFSLSVNSSRTDLSGGLISKANGTVKHQQYWDTGGYNFALSASSGNFKFTGGNVGIGTTSPGSKLEIHKSITYGSYGPAAPQLNLVNTDTEGTAGFLMLSARYNNTSPAQTFYPVGGIGGGKETALANNEWGGYINFFTTSDGTAGAASARFEHMRITADGNVGIGTASPTHKLHVNGDMRLTGALRDSNNAKGSAGQVLSSTGSATDWIPLPATPTIYTPKVFNIDSGTNINAQGRKLLPDFGTLEIEGNTTIQQVSGSDTDFQVTGENTGIYEVTYAVFYKNTGNQRTPLGTYLTLNGTAVNGSLMVNYVRSNVAGGGNFSSCTNTFYVNVTDASHPMALCARRADSSTAPSGISTVEPTGMAVKSTISFRRIS